MQKKEGERERSIDLPSFFHSSRVLGPKVQLLPAFKPEFALAHCGQTTTTTLPTVAGPRPNNFPPSLACAARSATWMQWDGPLFWATCDSFQTWIRKMAIWIGHFFEMIPSTFQVRWWGILKLVTKRNAKFRYCQLVPGQLWAVGHAGLHGHPDGKPWRMPAEVPENKGLILGCKMDWICTAPWGC